MPKIKIPMTSTHHISTRFDCPIGKIWDDIVVGLGRGKRFERQGYRIEPIIDDPRAYRGGYRIWRDSPDDCDERLSFITEQDEMAKRLSLCAYYVGGNARGTVVHATYAAIQKDDGNWYQIDCHGTRDLDIEVGTTPAEVAIMMSRSNQEMDRYLRAALESQKAELESSAI